MVQSNVQSTTLTRALLGPSCHLVTAPDGDSWIERRPPGSLALRYETPRAEDLRLAAVLAWASALPESVVTLWGEECEIWRANTTSGRWAVAATAPSGTTHILRSLRDVSEGIFENDRLPVVVLPEEVLPF